VQANPECAATVLTSRRGNLSAADDPVAGRQTCVRVNEFEADSDPKKSDIRHSQTQGPRVAVPGAMAGRKNSARCCPRLRPLAAKPDGGHCPAHYGRPISGGISFSEGHIAAMQTGEGKTLTATLPLYLHSLLGKRSPTLATGQRLSRQTRRDVIDATFRDARCDRRGSSKPKDDQGASAEELFRRDHLRHGQGVSVDFLRDRLLLRAQNRTMQTEMAGGGDGGFFQIRDQIVMRACTFCLVDEADSILIDEARTPLIIAALEETDTKPVAINHRVLCMGIGTLRRASNSTNILKIDKRN